MIIIIVLIVTLTTAKVVTTLVQVQEEKKFAETEQQDNERVVYVNSTTKDESENIVNETDENGNIVQVPVPKGYSASQIDGETTASKGFVIYEGDVDWNTILVGNDTTANNLSTNTESTVLENNEEQIKQNAAPENKAVIEQKDETEDKTVAKQESLNDENSEENVEDETSTEDITTNESNTTDETETTVTQQDINIFNLQKTRNQYVWVPVDDPSRIYGVDSNGKIWGKLYEIKSPYTSRTPLNWTENDGIMDIIDKKLRWREPDILPSNAWQNDGYSYTHSSGLGQTRYEMLAQELEENYYEIMASIKKYGGFYIGRYETGGLNGIAVVRKMDTNISNQNVNTMYKKCLTLKGNNDNIKTTMITGSLWDETIEWLVKSEATNSEGVTLTYQSVRINSLTWGNYKASAFKYIAENAEIPKATENKELNKSTKIPTGSTEYTKINNIYDMAGNVSELTREIYFNVSFVDRGDDYYYNSKTLYSRGSKDCAYMSSLLRLSCNSLHKIIYKKAKIYTKFTKNKKERKKEKNDRKAEKNKIFCLIFCQ